MDVNGVIEHGARVKSPAVGHARHSSSMSGIRKVLSVRGNVNLEPPKNFKVTDTNGAKLHKKKKEGKERKKAGSIKVGKIDARSPIISSREQKIFLKEKT